MANKQVWFPAKRYGIGWTLPVTWQGWAVLLIYTVSLIALSARVSVTTQTQLWLLCFLPTSLIFLAIVMLKGERPVRWRWGGN
ncbi:hypothetical protein [Pseudoalteromonas sp. GB56]